MSHVTQIIVTAYISILWAFDISKVSKYLLHICMYVHCTCIAEYFQTKGGQFSTTLRLLNWLNMTLALYWIKVNILVYFSIQVIRILRESILFNILANTLTDYFITGVLSCRISIHIFCWNGKKRDFLNIVYLHLSWLIFS